MTITKCELDIFTHVHRQQEFALPQFLESGGGEGWFSFSLAEQVVRDSNQGLSTSISKIGHILVPSRDMTERLLMRQTSSQQPDSTNQ